MNSLSHVVRSPGREYFVVAGSFAPNGTSAVDATTVKGNGVASVARTDVGDFTITFSHKYVDLISVCMTVQLNTEADMDVNPKVFTQASKTLTLTTHVAGVATDIAANANNRINFICVFRNSFTG